MNNPFFRDFYSFRPDVQLAINLDNNVVNLGDDIAGKIEVSMLHTIAKPLLAALLTFILILPAQAQNLGTVFFDFDVDTLDSTAQAQVAEIAEQLLKNPSYKQTVVVGYTDAVGTSAYNQDLGLRRARAVADALLANGVTSADIADIKSRGKNDLVVAVATAERQNRRVRVTLAEIMGACRSYRNIALNSAGFGAELQADLQTRFDEAVAAYNRLETNGDNGPAYQMAGAAKHDCGIATTLEMSEGRKEEYSQKCFCSSARMRVALSQ